MVYFEFTNESQMPESVFEYIRDFYGRTGRIESVNNGCGGGDCGLFLVDDRTWNELSSNEEVSDFLRCMAKTIGSSRIHPDFI